MEILPFERSSPRSRCWWALGRQSLLPHPRYLLNVKQQSWFLINSSNIKVYTYLNTVVFRIFLRKAPESLATASAAKTAVASCRVSTMRIPTFSQATRMGEMCPPTRVKTYLTPWARSTAATLSPPCLGLSTSVWTKVTHQTSKPRANPPTSYWLSGLNKVVKENKGGSQINCCQCELEAHLKVTSATICSLYNVTAVVWS